MREWLKLEFNGELIWIKEVKGSKTAAHMIGRSTKGRDVLQPFMEQVLVWLMGTFLRCSLRQQQLGWGRGGSTISVTLPLACMCAGAWDNVHSSRGLPGRACGAPSSARKVGAKLWSVLLLWAAAASVSM